MKSSDRLDSHASDSTLMIGPWAVDIASASALSDSRTVRLTNRELAVLWKRLCFGSATYGTPHPCGRTGPWPPTTRYRRVRPFLALGCCRVPAAGDPDEDLVDFRVPVRDVQAIPLPATLTRPKAHGRRAKPTPVVPSPYAGIACQEAGTGRPPITAASAPGG